MTKQRQDSQDKGKWWVVLDPDGDPLKGDGASSNLSVFTSKENAEGWAKEMADALNEENMYSVVPVTVQFLDEPTRRAQAVKP